MQEGDTADSIAARYGIDLQYLLAANPDLRDGEELNVGQMLMIPSGNGALYQIGFGDTLRDIAARYGVTVEAIVSWPGNGLSSPEDIAENQLVFIPNAVLPIATPSPTPP